MDQVHQRLRSRRQQRRPVDRPPVPLAEFQRFAWRDAGRLRQLSGQSGALRVVRHVSVRRQCGQGFGTGRRTGFRIDEPQFQSDDSSGAHMRAHRHGRLAALDAVQRHASDAAVASTAASSMEMGDAAAGMLLVVDKSPLLSGMRNGILFQRFTEGKVVFFGIGSFKDT